MPPQPTRRSFLTSGIALATTLQLQHAAQALGLAYAPAVCQLTPEQEQGPYYVADELVRDHIAEDRTGIPLSLRLVVLDARTCAPLSNAAIDLWHCDALGLYAGFTKQNPMGPGGPGGRPPGPPPDFDPQHAGNHPGPPEAMGPPPPINSPSDKLTFCRGIQLTTAKGAVTFKTVFPGFYMGRTNHIHFKVRLNGHPDQHTYAAGHTSHVGQIFFPEDLAIELMQHEPYRSHTIHRTSQREDDVFTHQHGSLSVARLRPVPPGPLTSGLEADLVAAVDPTANPALARRAGDPPPQD